MKQIRAVIIDDEKSLRETLKQKLKDNCKSVEIIGESTNVNDSIKLINETKPDLLFLDIELKQGTGFDVLDYFSDRDFAVIFITGFNDYAIKAFKFSALDYLLKPIDADDLVKAVDKVIKNKNLNEMHLQIKVLTESVKQLTTGKRIVLNTTENIHVVDVNDIIRCESDRNYTTFYLKNNISYYTSKTLKEYDELLTEYGFFRSHKSHLININYIDRYDKQGKGNIVLKDGSKVSVSVRRKELLIKLLGSL